MEHVAVSQLIQKRYHDYFKLKLGDQDKSFAPHVICKGCNSNLSSWEKQKIRKLPFSIPMIWREQKNHTNDCYFCLVNVTGINKRFRKSIKYPNLPSAMRPIPFETNESYPVPTVSPISDESSSCCNEESDKSWEPDSKDKKVDQGQLDELVRSLHLSKKDSEVAASLLKKFGVLDNSAKISAYRKRDEVYKPYFDFYNEDKIAFCKDVYGLFKTLGFESDVSNDWWLFIDGSVSSIKAVLLNSTDDYPAVPVAFSRHCKETYEVLKTVLSLINFSHYKWKTLLTTGVTIEE